jgi:hypothetical protein
MHMRQPVIVLVGIKSFFSFVITMTPDFLGRTYSFAVRNRINDSII